MVQIPAHVESHLQLGSYTASREGRTLGTNPADRHCRVYKGRDEPRRQDMFCGNVLAADEQTRRDCCRMCLCLLPSPTHLMSWICPSIDCANGPIDTVCTYVANDNIEGATGIRGILRVC